MAERSTVGEDGGAGAQSPPRFADRYELHELLGQGGMASVHRATDLANGRSVALKRLIREERDEVRANLELSFEREFHTLAQLSHPRVIGVYDYGITNDGESYYTMELLDGGDLRARAPMPWQEACRIAFEICSSLALLHSRRLLHRDISPRNIRCTRDGSAKLIDFGAMAPMSGGGSPTVGTPAFTAPETVHRSALDARTDLYSLGASLYYALTGQLVYPARSFSDLFTAWNDKPLPPSARRPGLPPELDDLVMSLLSLEPALRPPSAFAVMQRLAAIADLPSEEAESVSRAYLATPVLVGRDALLAELRDSIVRALSVGGHGVLLRAEPGLGRSRMLDACALEAKTLGARVLRATASGKPLDFEVALALTLHLVDALPSPALVEQFPQLFASTPEERPRLRDFTELKADPSTLQQLLARLFRAASKLQSLVLAVDDVHSIDEPSAAVLAALIDRSRLGRACVVLTADAEADESAPAMAALARRCERRTLSPLSESETQTLLASVFGDLPDLALLAGELYGIARGNPRQTMDLAQYLVDRGSITYEAGTWTLPRRLSHEDLPESADAAIRARIERLSPLARMLAEAHALSWVERLSGAMYHALAAGSDARAVDAAVNELVSAQALVGDGKTFVVANRIWSAALLDGLDAAARAERHRALCGVFRTRFDLAWIHHAFAAGSGDDKEALDVLLERQKQYQHLDHRQLIELEVGKLAESYPRAIEVAERLGRPARERFELLYWLTAISVAAAEPRFYHMGGARLLEQLVHDSGLDLYRQDAQNPDAGARLTTALTKAFERHQALPESERVYRVDEAIPNLAMYVAVSIAIGVRTMDLHLIRTLPPLLEPFAPLSPLLDALWQNAVCTHECYEACHYESARARWIEVHAKLANVTDADLRQVSAIRNAIAYGVGTLEAAFGLASAASWADELDQDPYQKVSGLYLRKCVRLEQGDWTGAEKLHRQAEVLALQARVPQMFATTLTVEISAHALARDLAGVKNVIERERFEAALYPGWIPYLREAEARFELIRGDYDAAREAFERVIASCDVDANASSECMPVWVAAQGGLCDALLCLDRAADAHATAVAALDVCSRAGIHVFANELVRLLAIAEAKLGDFAAANARLDRLIAAQTELGVTGLRIGLAYEARAEIALWNHDGAAFDQFARLTAREYRHGAHCPLGARYERLVREAQRRGFAPSATLSDFEPTTMAASSASGLPDLHTAVRIALTTDDPNERYLRALRLVCSSRAARGGHLYLPANDGPQLAASCDLGMPAPGLAERVRDYLLEQEDRFDTLTVALNNDVTAADATIGSPTVTVDGVDYELLLLSCVHDHEAQIAGVIAMAPSTMPQPNPRQTQLLSTIAGQLVRSGEPGPTLGA